MEIRVTDREWEFIERHLSRLADHSGKKGRPNAPDRQLFEGILWVLVTGSRWRDLPKKIYPAKSSCHRRFQEWNRDGSWAKVQRAILFRLKHMGRINADEAFVDGSFIKAKKGA